MFDSIGKLKPQVTYKFWATPGQGQKIEELCFKMREIGNQVLEVDRKNNRVLVAQLTEEQDRWGCIICLKQYSAIVICDSEEELLAHCDEEHEGWRDG